MRKTCIGLLLILTLGLLVTGSCLADNESTRRDYAVGWQFSSPASGLTIKVPVGEEYYLQPVFAFSMIEQDQNTEGHFALGLRGILDFPTRNNFHPYTGISWGYDEDFHGNNPAESTVSKGSSGFAGFFGVEYQKYLLRPAFEIGMGSFQNADDSYYAGIICNFSVLYYF